MSEPCTPCDKTDDGEISENEDVGAIPKPICLRCDKPINTDEDFELYAHTHYFHTDCVESALAAIVLTAPTLEEIKQLKEAREQMQEIQKMFKDPNMMSKMMGLNIGSIGRGYPLWEESEDSKNDNR